MREQPGHVLSLVEPKLRATFSADRTWRTWAKRKSSKDAKRRLREWREPVSVAHRWLWPCAALGLLCLLWRTRRIPIAAALGIAGVASLLWLSQLAVALLGVALLGVRLLRGPPPVLSLAGPLPWLAVAVPALFAAIHVLFFGGSRFQVPMLPWAALLVGLAVAQLIAPLWPSRLKQAPTTDVGV
jgi:hypothetical protein